MGPVSPLVICFVIMFSVLKVLVLWDGVFVCEVSK